MITFKLLICSLALDTFIPTCFSSPSLYPLSPCTIVNSFEFYVGIPVSDCILECNKRASCVAINYNRFNALCALRNNSSVDLTGLEPEWCYDVVINNETELLKGPCNDKPCDDTSICRSSTRQPYFTCKRAYCTPETNISNASFRNKELTSVGRTNQLQCDIGYTPLGLLSLTCLPDGNWTTTDLHCLKNCPPIPLKSTATVTSWSTYRFVLNTTVAYTCKEGFYNITERIVFCDEYGEWSAFECIPYCRQYDVISIENGFPKSGDNYTINMQAEYTCNPGYYLSPGSGFVTCDVYGKWSQPEVTCFPFCKQTNIPLVTNGKPLFGTLYNFTMTAKYNCDTGYYLSAGSPEITCDPTGSWSSPEVECYPYCQQLVIQNGFIQTQVPGPFTKDVTVQYDCIDGFYAHPFAAASTATCLKTGSWISASCFRYCGSAPDYTWEVVSSYSAPAPYRVGTVATYQCTAGGLSHFSGGGETKTCNTQGQWNGEVHCCAQCFEYVNGGCTFIPSHQCFG